MQLMGVIGCVVESTPHPALTRFELSDLMTLWRFNENCIKTSLVTCKGGFVKSFLIFFGIFYYMDILQTERGRQRRSDLDWISSASLCGRHLG